MPADYFTGDLFSEWDLPGLVKTCLGSQAEKLVTEADPGDREAAFRQALLLVDTLPFKGEKVDEQQPLAFPRVINKEVVAVEGAFSYAVAVEAYCMLEEQSSRDATVEALAKSGISSYSLDDFSVSFGNRQKKELKKLSGLEDLHDLAYRLLKPYLLYLRGGGTCRVTY